MKPKNINQFIESGLPTRFKKGQKAWNYEGKGKLKRKIYAEQEVIFKTDVKEFIRRLKEELEKTQGNREGKITITGVNRIIDKIAGDDLK